MVAFECSDNSQVDLLGLLYKCVSFGAVKSLDSYAGDLKSFFALHLPMVSLENRQLLEELLTYG